METAASLKLRLCAASPGRPDRRRLASCVGSPHDPGAGNWGIPTWVSASRFVGRMNAIEISPEFDPDGLQRASVLTKLPRLLAEFGVPPDRVLEPGLAPSEVFSNQNYALPYSALSRIVGRSSELTGCDHLGLLLGARCDERVLGVAGDWMRHASTLGAAVRGFVSLQPTNSRGATTYLHKFGDDVIIGYGIYDRTAVARHQMYALVMALALNVIQSLAGTTDRVLEVLFPFREPDQLRPYSGFFKRPIRFNQPECGLVLHPSALNAEIIGGNKGASFAEWAHRALGMLPAAEHEWTTRTRHILRHLYLLGENRVEDAAAQFGISGRSLARHLEREGTTFKALLDELRFNAARELLALTDLPVGEIALALSFATHSSFVGAFRRWSGSTPSAWRAAHVSLAPSHT